MSGIVAALLVIFAFGIIAIEMAITLIESYILTGAGVFMLGFAAFRGTASISERYLSFTIGVGLKLFVIYLLVGAGALLAPMWAELVTETTMLDYKVPFTIAFAALMYAAVAMRIPAARGSIGEWNGSDEFPRCDGSDGHGNAHGSLCGHGSGNSRSRGGHAGSNSAAWGCDG